LSFVARVFRLLSPLPSHVRIIFFPSDSAFPLYFFFLGPISGSWWRRFGSPPKKRSMFAHVLFCEDMCGWEEVLSFGEPLFPRFYWRFLFTFSPVEGELISLRYHFLVFFKVAPLTPQLKTSVTTVYTTFPPSEGLSHFLLWFFGTFVLFASLLLVFLRVDFSTPTFYFPQFW